MEYPKYIIGLKELNSEITNNYQKNILLVFTAVWCGPCQKLKSELVNTNQDGSRSGIQIEYQNDLNILYIDVDEEENEELMVLYKVSGMPTQVLIKPKLDKTNNSIKIEQISEIVGYDVIKLRMQLENI